MLDTGQFILMNLHLWLNKISWQGQQPSIIVSSREREYWYVMKEQAKMLASLKLMKCCWKLLVTSSELQWFVYCRLLSLSSTLTRCFYSRLLSSPMPCCRESSRAYQMKRRRSSCRSPAFIHSMPSCCPSKLLASRWDSWSNTVKEIGKDIGQKLLAYVLVSKKM